MTPVHVSVISLGSSWSPLGFLRQVSLRTSHCKSRSNVTPVHVSVISLEGPWSPLGVFRQVSLRTPHCKSRSNVMPVHVCYHFAHMYEIRWPIVQVAKVAQTLRLCMFG